MSIVDLAHHDEAESTDITAGAGPVAALSPMQLFWRRFRKDKVALGALVFIAILLFVAIFAPVVVKILGLPGPNEQNLGLLDAFGSATGPSSAHIMGVDDLGRDIFARVIYGARVSLEGHASRPAWPSLSV